jgi:hypothetical protein
MKQKNYNREETFKRTWKKLLLTASIYGFDIDINDAMAYLEYKYNRLKNGNKETNN